MMHHKFTTKKNELQVLKELPQSRAETWLSVAFDSSAKLQVTLHLKSKRWP
ncbi:hypothetical protein JHK82_023349 [Glycine max]|nr:hypothetical protein JHK87_023300 [Glycine soja]KAG5138618.1 hypothetical protein JHK82_023349 [Glycine max]